MKTRLLAAIAIALCALYVFIVLSPRNVSAGGPTGGSQLQITDKMVM